MLAHWTHHKVNANNVRQHYYRTNSGDSGKPPVVLVHGFSDNGLCWEPAAMALEAQFDVVMPDMRAHGLSARVQRGEKIDMAADLAALIAALGLDKPIIGGHSMGAAVAASFGARFPRVPRALVLEDPPWFEAPPEMHLPGFFDEEGPNAQWIKGLQRISLEEVMAQCRAEHPTWPEAIVRRWCEGKQQLDFTFFTAQDTLWKPWQELAPRFSCPTLLITADPEKGGIVSAAVARQAAEANPLIQVAHISGAGHHVRFENPAAYMQALASFLESVRSLAG